MADSRGGKCHSNDERLWYDKESARIRLVRSPITFGHSQLVVSCHQANGNDNATGVAVSFADAGQHIDSAIVAMTNCFTLECLGEFPLLAWVTQTSGKLIKILVLRASASEKPEEALKIHLVPYFESHHWACLLRFSQLHGELPGTPGGLLGWVGTQEDKVDAWEVDYHDKKKHEKWAGETLALNELSIELRNALAG